MINIFKEIKILKNEIEIIKKLLETKSAGDMSPRIFLGSVPSKQREYISSQLDTKTDKGVSF